MNFIHDLIHLIQGELLIKYWWLWLLIILLFIVYTKLFMSLYRVAKKIFKNAYSNYRKQQ